jgi:pyruvate formate-lyase/glycerol dehydratase family glycyl radical enzyme
VIYFAHRYARLAREMAEKETNVTRKQELERIAQNCEWVPANPARTFHEALQSFWFTHLVFNLESAADGDTPGRMDQYLYPLYEKDIATCRITRQIAAELLGCVWVKFNEMTNVKALSFIQAAQASQFQDVTIAGVTPDGKDATNELSFLLLEVTRQMRMAQPPLYVRYHKRINEELLNKAAETNRDNGSGNPAFINDDVVLMKMMERGVPLKEARNWFAAGCVGPFVPGFQPAIVGVFLNKVKAFELALNNGFDPITKKQLGPETGDPRSFNSYSELYGAFINQLKHQVKIAAKLYRAGEQARAELYCHPFNSVLINDCIKKGKTYDEGGSRYPQISPTFTDIGHQNVADSLTSIKKLVFEGKKITMAELLDALAANYEGYEEIRQMVLNAPKYGNDDDYADEIFNAVSLDAGRIMSEPHDITGYPILVGRGGGSGHYWAGLTLGALPDGRKAFEATADAALSPVQGMDTKGPTAVILSATKVNHMEYASSTVMNMKIMPSTVQTREGISKYISLIKTYFDRGGCHIQFNMIDRDVLLNAKKEPGKYKNLLVRVAGYSAYFVELAPKIQDEIISRTEQRL